MLFLSGEAGIAGTGMSALAQYLAMKGEAVAGSDRYFSQGQAADNTRQKLEALGYSRPRTDRQLGF